MMRSWLQAAAAAIGLMTGIAGASAQDYPNRPVRILVQFTAGGGADFVARVLSAELPAKLGQPVVVENRPGANGNIANKAVLSAPADGYTLLLGAAGPMTINPHIYGKDGVDTLTDFTPLGLVASSPFAVALNPSVPANSLAELIALAKSKPGTLNFASSGNGGAPHLSTELFKSMTGTDMVHVPYRGLAPALNDLVAGQLQLSFADVGLVAPFLQSGQLKVLATTGATRSPLMPNIPTIAEAGVPGYQSNTWYGLYAPAAVPAPIQAKLTGAMKEIVAQANVKERLVTAGQEPGDADPAALAAKQKAESDRWGELIRKLGIKPE